MTSRNLRTTLLLCLTFLTAFPQASQASSTAFHYPQLAKPVAQTRLRAGPSSAFPQIDIIRKAEEVIVRRCSNGWCVIEQQDGAQAGS